MNWSVANQGLGSVLRVTTVVCPVSSSKGYDCLEVTKAKDDDEKLKIRRVCGLAWILSRKRKSLTPLVSLQRWRRSLGKMPKTLLQML